MSVFTCWQAQREPLRQSLDGQSSMREVANAVRRALAQAEQNALAEMTDDVLRQQTGVLFSCLKSSTALMDVYIAATAWVPGAPKQPARGKWALWGISALLAILGGLYCYLKGLWPGWALALGALITGGVALLGERRTHKTTQDEVRVTLKPDAEALLSALDGQLRAFDRYINDFAYLNEQLNAGAQRTDPALLARAADLMEALYECDEASRAPALESASRILTLLGLRAVDYTPDSGRLFTTLPSRGETRTLSPAIVAAKDGRLLRRGTAAVRTSAA